MKRIVVFLFLTVLLFALMGCQLMDSLFFNAEEVHASDLSSFTGSTPTTKDEALTSALSGLMYATSATGIDSMMSSAQPSTESASDVMDMMMSFAEKSGRIYSDSIAIARTITPSSAIEDFQADVEADGNGTLDLKVVEEDFETEGVVIVNGTIELNVAGFTETSRAASGDVKVDVSAEMESFTGTPFNGASINLKVDADAEASLDSAGVLSSVSGYAALAVNAGISLDEVAGVSKGGKYIFSIKYTNQYTYASSDSDPVSSLETELTLRVFNASNSKVGEYTYTEDDISDYMESMGSTL